MPPRKSHTLPTLVYSEKEIFTAPNQKEASIADNLKFSFAWRLIPPADDNYAKSAIPPSAFDAFVSFMNVTARGNNAEEIYWIFRREFSVALGLPPYRSSSLYFAEFDATEAMKRAEQNAPVFIDAFYTACADVAEKFGTDKAPPVSAINQLLQKHNIGYDIEPPELRLRGDVALVPIQPKSVLARAREEFKAAIERSEELLRQKKGSEAVQQIWWLLESISTSFRGLAINGTQITGDYFNDVMKAVKKASDGTLLSNAARWVMDLQFYLSDTTGGGIRHGRELHLEGLQLHEAELLCNLTRSYISYLLAEYEHLASTPPEKG